MKELTKRLVIVLFPLALALPAVSILVPVDPVEIENRRLEGPEISLENLMDPRFYREVGAYIRDANPVRTLMIRAGTGIDYHLFGDSPNPLSTLVGHDGWLYRREYIDELCRGAPRAAAANLLALVRAMEHAGSQVVYTVAPAKFTITPEYLTDDQTRLAACAFDSANLLRTTLKSSSRTGYVDSWTTFSSVKALGFEPYFKTDTHFNYIGSIPWLHALLETIQPGIWEVDAVRNEGIVNFVGNIATQVGLEFPEAVRQVVIDRGLPRTPVEQLHDRFGATWTATQRYQAPAGIDVPLIPGRTVVLGDSFMEIPAPSLVQYFEDITIMDWRSRDSIDYFLQQAVGAHLVIIETTDHGLLTRFADDTLLESFQRAEYENR